MNEKKHRRKFKLVKKGFQVRFILILIIVVFVVSVLSLLLFYKTVITTMSLELANTEVGERFISWAFPYFTKNILLTFVMFVFVALFLGVYYSGKIAGPLYRIEFSIKKMTEGLYPIIIKVRSSDEPDLIKIAGELNKLNTKIKDDIFQIKEYVSSLNSNLENKDKLKEGLKALDDLLAKHQIPDEKK